MKWIVPKIKGDLNSLRYYHTANIYNKTKMIVFGGVNSETLAEADELFCFDYSKKKISI